MKKTFAGFLREHVDKKSLSKTMPSAAVAK
jgi:hypothetical protein